MKVILGLVVLVCVQVSSADTGTYRAGIVKSLKGNNGVSSYREFARKAEKLNIDILMLPSQRSVLKENSEEFCGINNYDEIVKSLSEIAKESKLYVVANIPQELRSDSGIELFENGVVFDREGRIISVFRKALQQVSSCNSSVDHGITFETDFGVTFHHVAGEELVIRDPKDFGSVKHFLISGDWTSELPFLTVTQYVSSWVETVGANLLGSNIFGGKEVKSLPIDSVSRILVVELQKEPKVGQLTQSSLSATPRSVIHEDLSQYSIRPLNFQASSRGVQETVCHGRFCCKFYVKTSDFGDADVPDYSFVVFDGLRQFGASNLGVQTCALVACGGFYKRSCVIGTKNSTADVIFDKITITGNFSSDNTVQYPTTLSTIILPMKQNVYSFDSKTVMAAKEITMKLTSSNNLVTFGIFGRDFSKDSERVKYSMDNNIYDYIFNNDMNEFVDYIWIRLRVVIVVVSIYVLEMM